ncbi:MAG: glycosyltransferase family 4 protein [Anaerolineae bacterium]|nr:MAG: glycosyltransferase family 4 protein [Anaerolineae bacterium]
MRFYVDVSAAVHSRAGLGRYSESLARHLIADDDARQDYALFYNRDRTIYPLVGLEGVPARTVPAGYKPWRMAVLLGQWLRLGFNRLVPEARLFHATEHLLMPLRGVPTVMTVHDLIFRHFPQYHKRLNYWYLNLAMPLYVRRADAIITVSECSGHDLISAYGVPPEKVTVVYEAADAHFVPPPPDEVMRVRARYDLPERFLLTVGTVEPRKNLSRLLAAFEVVARQGLVDAWVIVGRLGWLYDDFFSRLEVSPMREKVILPGFVPDQDLPAVNAAATVAVLPSLYEGFRLPVLEAMACGTPVVCSYAASLPEFGGEAASYFDPRDVEAMAVTLAEVLPDQDLRFEMRRLGFVQAARFSWKRAARETRLLYDRLTGGRGRATQTDFARSSEGNGV